MLVVMALVVSAAACGSESDGTIAASTGLQGVRWQWRQLVVTTPAKVIDVPDPSTYTMELQPGGTVDIDADCNHGVGTYTTAGSALTIDLGGFTRSACAPGSLSNEYLADLVRVESYEITDAALVLTLADGGGDMRFSESEPAPAS